MVVENQIARTRSYPPSYPYQTPNCTFWRIYNDRLPVSKKHLVEFYMNICIQMDLIYTEEFYKLKDYMKKNLTHSKERRRIMQRLWKSKTFQLEPKPIIKPQVLKGKDIESVQTGNFWRNYIWHRLQKLDIKILDVERSVDETQHYQYIRIHAEGLRNGS